MRRSTRATAKELLLRLRERGIRRELARSDDLERTKELQAALARIREAVRRPELATLGSVNDPLVIAGRELRSRLITGTGKYSSPEMMRDAVIASGCELVTVAVGRIDLDTVEEAITDYLPDGRNAAAEHGRLGHGRGGGADRPARARRRACPTGSSSR